MIAKYVQQGETMDYKAAKALHYGDVVNLGTRIGIAANDIPAGAVGSVRVCGVFELPFKAGESAAELPAGTALFWDAEAKAVTADKPVAEATEGTAADIIPAGYAFEAVAKGAEKALVKLLG